MVYRIPTRDSNTDEVVHPLAWWHFALLIGIVLTPQIVTIVTNFGHVKPDLRLSLFRLSEFISYLAAFALPFNFNGGSFARLARSRAFANPNTAAVWIAVVPALTLILAAICQLKSIANLTLDNNFFESYYKGKVHAYSPLTWFFLYGFGAIRTASFAWIAILALTLNQQTSRFGVISALITARIGVDVLLGLSFHFLKISPPPHLLKVSSMPFYIAEMLAKIVVDIFLLMLFEKAFRPSLVAVSIWFACQYILSGLFESPTDAYFLVAQLVASGIVWAVLRNSKWGSEKWLEYQQRQEPLQS
jgi:hypothetical protein